MTIAVLDLKTDLPLAVPAMRESVTDDVDMPCMRDPELWFAELPADVERAKAQCLVCPLQRECLEGALERREPWGVWGGELFLQGAVIPRKRPRGRPRKSEKDEVAA